MRVLLTLIGALAIIVAIGAAVFFFGGFFNVAANEEDPGIVNWALIKVRSVSIARHDGARSPVNLDDPKIIRAGARKFAELACANCHGAPGVNYQKYAEGMNPGPPDLAKEEIPAVPGQIFWVVKNGIRMTGMPSFAEAAKDDEIWSIVAFVRKLHSSESVSPDDYKEWTANP
jgi:mono/diheme cytochrome c family protein